ncbi:antirestriction protein ArdA [Legionella gresilensis]|uniref:antirestriction protein ArdA n=1 Tax=Legionella gresilensis TaxID=91823 RepID=UPI0010418DEC|nr:antirestriction protein ArdA [Legionella gresilensis]
MLTPSIYVACLASYNHGILHGTWINANQGTDEISEEIQTMLAQSMTEDVGDYAIHDYEGFGNINLSEYEDLETITQYTDFIATYGKLGQALIADVGFKETQTMMTDDYVGCYDSEIDFAWHILEECYSHAIPDNLISYFDCEAFARDLFLSDYCSVEANGETHVFSRY